MTQMPEAEPICAIYSELEHSLYFPGLRVTPSLDFHGLRLFLLAGNLSSFYLEFLRASAWRRAPGSQWSLSRGALPRKRKLANKLSCFCFVVVLGLGLKR